MLLGYNTNGLAHHNPFQAVELLAELGYQSVALTLDHGCLNPGSEQRDADVARMRALLRRLNMRSVVETGARFLLNPRIKHEPTLVSPTAEERARRISFLKQAIDIAEQLESDCVSLWSGVARQPASSADLMERLRGGLLPVLDYAAEKKVLIGFEPEPGMVIDTMAAFAQLCEQMAHSQLRLTLDIGHLHCQGEVPIADQIRRWGPQLVNVHLEDMRAGTHEHLMFGEGEMDFSPIMAALSEVGYDAGVHLELSRHSHQGVHAAHTAREFLRRWFP